MSVSKGREKLKGCGQQGRTRDKRVWGRCTESVSIVVWGRVVGGSRQELEVRKGGGYKRGIKRKKRG